MATYAVKYSEGPEAVSMKAFHSSDTFNALEGLDDALPAWSGTASELCIGWVDVSRLTRECLTGAVARAQPLFVIIPFESISDCALHKGRVLDLIVYHSHEPDRVALEDVSALREAFATVQMVVLSDASAIEPAIAREVLTRGAAGFSSMARDMRRAISTASSRPRRARRRAICSAGALTSITRTS